jgi:hypothetical protein
MRMLTQRNFTVHAVGMTDKGQRLSSGQLHTVILEGPASDGPGLVDDVAQKLFRR